MLPYPLYSPMLQLYHQTFTPVLHTRMHTHTHTDVPLVDQPGMLTPRSPELATITWLLPDNREFLTAVILTITSSVPRSNSRRKRQDAGTEVRVGADQTSVNIPTQPYSEPLSVWRPSSRPRALLMQQYAHL